ncbi:hypothetical protein Rin_00008100, partial [Candidatus Regiella insecticola 5.15]
YEITGKTSSLREGISINNLTAQTFIQALQPIRASGRLETV